MKDINDKKATDTTESVPTVFDDVDGWFDICLDDGCSGYPDMCRYTACLQICSQTPTVYVWMLRNYCGRLCQKHK